MWLCCTCVLVCVAVLSCCCNAPPHRSCTWSPASAALANCTQNQATWDNHFGGFNTADIPKILADYTETSEVQVYNETTGEKKVYVGQEAIGGLFAGIFELLGEHSANLKAPVLDVNAEQKQVCSMDLLCTRLAFGR